MEDKESIFKILKENRHLFKLRLREVAHFAYFLGSNKWPKLTKPEEPKFFGQYFWQLFHNLGKFFEDLFWSHLPLPPSQHNAASVVVVVVVAVVVVVVVLLMKQCEMNMNTLPNVFLWIQVTFVDFRGRGRRRWRRRRRFVGFGSETKILGSH